MGFFTSLFGGVSKEVLFTLKHNCCFKKLVLGILVLMTIQFSAISTYGLSYANQSNNVNVVYALFPTQNVWTFLKLNTRDGRITQVHYDVKNNRMEVDLTTAILAEADSAQNGRFTLQPTNNMYNFILLDQIDGRVWQVQWSVEKENRLILPINRY